VDITLLFVKLNQINNTPIYNFNDYGCLHLKGSKNVIIQISLLL